VPKLRQERGSPARNALLSKDVPELWNEDDTSALSGMRLVQEACPRGEVAAFSTGRSATVKICVTSQGPELTSQVDPRFGRARFFIIYDDATEAFEAVDNVQNVNAGGGAGIQSATTVAEKGCEWVVSGHMGPKALSVLQEAGIKIAVGASGKVSDAIRDFADGKLEEVESADVAPRW